MTLKTLVKICREYARLGDAITEQISGVLDGSPEPTGALRHIEQWLTYVKSENRKHGTDEMDEDLDADVIDAMAVLADVHGYRDVRIDEED